MKHLVFICICGLTAGALICENVTATGKADSPSDAEGAEGTANASNKRPSVEDLSGITCPITSNETAPRKYGSETSDDIFYPTTVLPPSDVMPQFNTLPRRSRHYRQSREVSVEGGSEAGLQSPGDSLADEIFTMINNSSIASSGQMLNRRYSQLSDDGDLLEGDTEGKLAKRTSSLKLPKRASWMLSSSRRNSKASIVDEVPEISARNKKETRITGLAAHHRRESMQFFNRDDISPSGSPSVNEERKRKTSRWRKDDTGKRERSKSRKKLYSTSTSTDEPGSQSPCLTSPAKKYTGLSTASESEHDNTDVSLPRQPLWGTPAKSKTPFLRSKSSDVVLSDGTAASTQMQRHRLASLPSTGILSGPSVAMRNASPDCGGSEPDVLPSTSTLISEAIPEAVSETILEVVSEKIHEAVSDTSPNAGSETTESTTIPEVVSEATPDMVSDNIPKSIPEATAPELEPAPERPREFEREKLPENRASLSKSRSATMQTSIVIHPAPDGLPRSQTFTAHDEEEEDGMPVQRRGRSGHISSKSMPGIKSKLSKLKRSITSRARSHTTDSSTVKIKMKTGKVGMEYETVHASSSTTSLSGHKLSASPQGSMSEIPEGQLLHSKRYSVALGPPSPSPVQLSPLSASVGQRPRSYTSWDSPFMDCSGSLRDLPQSMSSTLPPLRMSLASPMSGYAGSMGSLHNLQDSGSHDDGCSHGDAGSTVSTHTVEDGDDQAEEDIVQNVEFLSL